MICEIFAGGFVGKDPGCLPAARSCEILARGLVIPPVNVLGRKSYGAEHDIFHRLSFILIFIPFFTPRYILTFVVPVRLVYPVELNTRLCRSLIHKITRFGVNYQKLDWIN